MSEVTLAKVGSARRRTWRDAITPQGRASRRRWALVFPVLLCLSAWMAVTTYDDGGPGVGLLAVVAPVIVFGMLRRSTPRLTALDHPELDERDRLLVRARCPRAGPRRARCRTVRGGARWIARRRARRRVGPWHRPGREFFALLPFIGVLALLGGPARRPN